MIRQTHLYLMCFFCVWFNVPVNSYGRIETVSYMLPNHISFEGKLASTQYWLNMINNMYRFL